MTMNAAVKRDEGIAPLRNNAKTAINERIHANNTIDSAISRNLSQESTCEHPKMSNYLTPMDMGQKSNPPMRGQFTSANPAPPPANPSTNRKPSARAPKASQPQPSADAKPQTPPTANRKGVYIYNIYTPLAALIAVLLHATATAEILRLTATATAEKQHLRLRLRNAN